MSKYKVEFTSRVNIQLRSIFSYIAENNAAAAVKMVDRIEERSRRLADAPFVGVELTQGEYPFLPPGYRRLVSNPFLIYSRVIEKTVYITHIVHSRRNQWKALKEDI